MTERVAHIPEREYSALEGWLSQGYSGTVLKGVDKTADFAAALRESPDLKTEALAKLKSLTDVICKRDYISKVHKDVLSKALAESEKEAGG